MTFAPALFVSKATCKRWFPASLEDQNPYSRLRRMFSMDVDLTTYTGDYTLR